MSEEISDTDSTNSEIVNSVYCVDNVHNENNTDEDCKGKSELKHTNHTHDSRTSLINTSHDTSPNNITNDIICMHYVNMVMDDMTKKDDTKIIELTSKDQESHTLNTLDCDLNFNELAHTGKCENFVLLNN